METNSTTNTENKHVSELDKFKLFFEISTTTKEERARLKRQSRN